MKIALIHDHLAQDGGAERVLMVLKEMYPEAPIFTSIFDRKNTNSFFADKEVRTSFIQRLPFGVSHYQWWVGFMPLAMETHNLTNYDLIISSASAFAKGVITGPGSRHICYCHTPTRYLWTDTHSYVRELRVNAIVKSILLLTLKKLRMWDRLAAERVDEYIANSETIKRRIKKYYGRDSRVIYPPVDTSDFYISPYPKKFYLAGSRLVPYKRIDLVVKAFSRLGIPLKIFGVGPEMKALKKIAKDNVEFLGRVSDRQKRWLFANCIAYVNPQEEDFGITAIEAMASGRPIIAYGAGGALETVKEGETGEFFDEQIWEDIADKVMRFDQNKFDAQKIKEHASQFDVERFREKIREIVNNF